MSIQSNINSIIGSVGTAAYLMKDLKFKKNVPTQTLKDDQKQNFDHLIDKDGLKRARAFMTKTFRGREEAELSLGTRQQEIQYMKDLEESRAKGEIGF